MRFFILMTVLIFTFAVAEDKIVEISKQDAEKSLKNQENYLKDLQEILKKLNKQPISSKTKKHITKIEVVKKDIAYLKQLLASKNKIMIPSKKWEHFAHFNKRTDLKIFADKKRPIYSPYPGGSPFPPGGEPTLTHKVSIYWTTLGGMETQVDVTANKKNQRPTQVDCEKFAKGRSISIRASIHSHCWHYFRFLATKPDKKLAKSRINRQLIINEGHGNLLVKVFGFRKQGFDTPPVVEVRYLLNGQIVGKTSIQAQAIAQNFKEK